MNQFIVAFLLTTIGFSVFYFVPLAFINGNYQLVFLLLSFILQLEVIGMTFLCTLVFTYLERLLLWLTLHTVAWKDRRLYRVVVKNMEGH